jgi:hypothetical protein
MGGMLLGVQQARHATFAAVAILGHGVGLPTVLTEEELSGAHDGNMGEEVVVTLARTRFAAPAAPAASRPPPGSFLPADLAEPVRTAFAAQQTELLFSCGLTAMLPGYGSGESGHYGTRVPRIRRGRSHAGFHGMRCALQGHQ